MTFGDNVLALCVEFNGRTVWSAKVAMTEDHAVVMTKDGELISCKPEFIYDEFLLED
jgi:hypothetical protein